MRHHELALDHSNKLPLQAERFASYDAFVAGYEAALNDLKMPKINRPTEDRERQGADLSIQA
jgi:hypothetical protein